MGVSPSEYRRLTFRRLMQLSRAHTEQNDAQWRRTATLSAFIVNCAGMGQPKGGTVSPAEIVPHAFSDADHRRGMSRERYEANMKRHQERKEREQSDED